MTPNGRHFDVGAGETDDGRFDRPAEIFGVSGCAALFRTEALVDARISTGFFDDDFFVYREDVDLAWRLRGRGWTARCVPAARAWHRRRNLPERRREMSALANLHSVKNRFLLRINNAGKEHLAATFARTFLRDALVVGGCLTVERTSLEALRWLAVNRSRLLAKRLEIQGRRTVTDRGAPAVVHGRSRAARGSRREDRRPRDARRSRRPTAASRPSPRSSPRASPPAGTT